MTKQALLKMQEAEMFTLLANNCYHIKSSSARAVGFKTSSFNYSERGNLYNIAEDFLINSFLKRHDVEVQYSIASYLQDDGLKLIANIGNEDFSAFECFPLTDGVSLDLPLGLSIANRRSYRNFTGDPLLNEQLATILRAAIGISAVAEAPLTRNGEVRLQLRTIPSGGGLYPIDLYVAALNVSDLEKGIYQYHANEDKLIKIADKQTLGKVLHSFSGTVDLVANSNASAIFLFVAKPWRSMRKYGNRGLRFVLQEVGAIAQLIHLTVAALGLGSVDCASFFEEEIHQTLGFDGISQVVLHSTLVGVIP